MAALTYDVQGMNYTATAQAGLTNTSNAQYTIGTATTLSNNYVVGADSNGTLWQFWQNQYYPYVIKESYPIYIQEKAMDKGKQAFEILKSLMDKKLLKLDKVSDFVEAMDTILKTL